MEIGPSGFANGSRFAQAFWSNPTGAVQRRSLFTSNVNDAKTARISPRRFRYFYVQ
jgi:hypothetical protein